MCNISVVDVEGGQTPLLMLHWNTLDPNPSVITCELGDVGATTNPGPEITVHEPEPTAGVFAFKVAVDAQVQIVGPATDAEGLRSRCTETVEDVGGQAPLPMVH